MRKKLLPLVYVSGFWSLITLLFLSMIPAYADWMAVEKHYLSPGILTVYVDPDTIRREGALVTMWQLIDYKTMQGGTSPTRFSSTKIQKLFDCAEGRTGLLRVTDFWGNMGTGESAAAYVEKGNWVRVEPDSMNQALWEVACGKE
ncbi:MAG: surface-adhesin E family protein [Nitrospirota bacterium]